MSNIPTPSYIPPTTQQIAGVLQSALNASEELLNADAGKLGELRDVFHEYFRNPSFTAIMGDPVPGPANPPPLTSTTAVELSDIKKTLLSLSKAVEHLQHPSPPLPPRTQAKTPKSKPA